MNACLAAHFREARNRTRSEISQPAVRPELGNESGHRRRCLTDHRARAVRRMPARFEAAGLGFVADRGTATPWLAATRAFLSRLWAGLSAPHRRAQAVDALRAIDPRTLADVGLSRGAAEFAIVHGDADEPAPRRTRDRAPMPVFVGSEATVPNHDEPGRPVNL